ncbi:hypothetical protein [Herbaspirillum sp. ST 5-3]|uniref:hypothetical protein n=1 Tax=Oxalobacteraceae TaxID=75682 RepID=UPI0010A43733|nr:hypothetical protein [Herbaspirillum sp. ST 5-3]
MNTFDTINFGKKDGVEVFHDEQKNEVVVVAPNQYDLIWQLKGKTEDGTPYSDQVAWNNTDRLTELSFLAKKSVDELQKKAVLVIPAGNLESSDKQKFFNSKVNKTRERVLEAATEYNSFFYRKDQDGTYRSKTTSDKVEEFLYKAAFEQPGERQPSFHFAKNDKDNPILSGEVAHVGKYYVVLYSGFGEDKINFDVVNTGKFLKGDQLKEQNREKEMQKILSVGEKVFIDRDKMGNVIEVSKEPIPLEKNHPELAAAAKVEKQTEEIKLKEEKAKQDPPKKEQKQKKSTRLKI